MPWWGWLIIAVPALLVACVAGISMLSRAFRALIRREFKDFLLTINPDVVVEGVTPQSMRVGLGTHPPWELAFEPVYAGTRDADTAQRRFSVYWQILSAACAEDPRRSAISAERHRRLIWPQLVAGDTSLPNRPLEQTGLRVVFMIKFGEEAAARNTLLRGLALPLADEHVRALGVDESTLFDWSMQNIAGSLPDEFIANVVDRGDVSAFQSADPFVACRILALPGKLQEGQAAVALIPDTESLVVMPFPDADEWTNIFEAAAIPLGAGAPLLPAPVIVTRQGFRLVEPPTQDESDES